MPLSPEEQAAADKAAADAAAKPVTHDSIRELVKSELGGVITQFKEITATAIKEQSTGFTKWLEDLAAEPVVTKTPAQLEAERVAADKPVADAAVAAHLSSLESRISAADAVVQEERKLRLAAEQRAEQSAQQAQVEAAIAAAKTSDPELAMSFVRDKVQKGTDGKLYIKVGDQTLPLADGVAAIVKSKPALQPPLGLRGSDATRSNVSDQAPAGGFDMDSITPTMTETQRAAAWAEVAKQAGL